MTNEYLTILQESLQKKSKVLDDIITYNEKQYAMFKEERASMDEFDQYVDEKGDLIDQIVRLDEGFEVLYQNVAKELQSDKAKYANQIKEIQALVTVVTEKSVSIQAQEARNKALIEQYFKKERDEIKKGRQTTKAAYDYYKTMNNTNVVPPQFLDQKK